MWKEMDGQFRQSEKHMQRWGECDHGNERNSVNHTKIGREQHKRRWARRAPQIL